MGTLESTPEKEITKMTYETILNITDTDGHKVTDVGGGWILVYNQNKLITKTEHGALNITCTRNTIECFKSETDLDTRIVALGFEVPEDA
jgi:hypothetical protein